MTEGVGSSMAIMPPVDLAYFEWNTDRMGEWISA